MEGQPSQNTSGWLATAGFGRALGAHLGWLIEYAYLNYSGSVGRGAYNSSQSGERVSLV